MANRLWNRCHLMMFVLLLPGCGGGGNEPEFVPAKGVVKYQGKGVGSVLVTFVPDKGLLATGTTDDAGNFKLTTNSPGDGAMVGNYKVTIRYMTTDIPPMQGLADAPKETVFSPVAKKYADPETSGLTATVGKDASKNNFTFEVTN